MNKLVRIGVTTLAVLGTAVLAACASSNGSSGVKTPQSSSAGAQSQVGGVKEAKQMVDKYYQGTDGAAPTTGPKAVAGVKLWIISCGEASEGCSTPVAAMKAAAQAIGWKVTVFDGKFNASNAYSSGIRQAVAAGARAILLQGIDCDPVKQALSDAKSAKVLIVNSDGFDCTGQSMFDVSIAQSAKNKTPADKFYEWGQVKAAWLIEKTGGKGKILDIDVTDVLNAQAVEKGFSDTMKAWCTACDIVRVPVTLADFSDGGVGQKTSSALLQNRDIVAVHVPFDALVLGAVAPALKQAGLSKVLVMGGEGNPANLNLIRSGSGQDAAVATDVTWWGWGAVDDVNRVLAGQPVIPLNIGYTLIDAEHNLPPNGQPYATKVDYQSAYLHIWGRP